MRTKTTTQRFKPEQKVVLESGAVGKVTSASYVIEGMFERLNLFPGSPKVPFFCGYVYTVECNAREEQLGAIQ